MSKRELGSTLTLLLTTYGRSITVPEWHESNIAVNRHPGGRGLTSMEWLQVLSKVAESTRAVHLHYRDEREGKRQIIDILSRFTVVFEVSLTVVVNDQAGFFVVDRADRCTSAKGIGGYMLEHSDSPSSSSSPSSPSVSSA